MDVADQFKILADEWQQHCRRMGFSSKMSTFLEHPSYRQIVALGEPAIPLIIERYRQDHLPWGFALEEITGMKMVEDTRSFKPKDVKQKWLDWWDQKAASTGGAGTR